MIDTITRFAQGIADRAGRVAYLTPVSAIGDRLSSKSLVTAGLAIKAAGSAIVKTGATDYYASVKGSIVRKAAATDMPALVGTVPNASFNVFAFFTDGAGTLTTLAGTPATTLAGIKQPAPPVGQAQLGFIIVNPTGAGAFVGGTTALDDATVVPNVVYINTIGAYDPTVLV